MSERYRQSNRFLAALTCVVGVVLVIATLGSGGGPLSAGVLVGVIFVGLGIARLVMSRRSRTRGLQ